MSAQESAHENAVVAKLIQIVDQKLPKDQAQDLAKFVKQYYASAAEEDLDSRDLLDLYGAVLSHWQFMMSRQPGEVKLRVYNPCFEKHGWQSIHTIVEIAHDDMPFLVDSLLMTLNRMGLNIHVVFHVGGMRVTRNKHGKITQILMQKEAAPDNATIYEEAPIFIEIDRQADDPELLNKIASQLSAVLADVLSVITDFKPMQQRLYDVISTMEQGDYRVGSGEINESVDFLKWLDQDHFTFIGAGEFKRVQRDGKEHFELHQETALGLLRNQHFQDEGFFLEDLDEAKEMMMSPHPLLISKSSFRSTVHRPAHMDSIGVKHYDQSGQVVSETRFLGLYTSTAYHNSPRHVPFLRRKVAAVINRSGFTLNSHDGKALLNVLEEFPRDELFQINESELYKIAIGVLQIQERQQIKLFIRRDTYGRYFSCMVYVPRDIFNTELRIKMQNILLRALNGTHATYSPNFLRSVSCRIDFLISLEPGEPIVDYDLKAIESTLVAAARNWKDELKEALVDSKGEHRGSLLYNKYMHAFPAGYREAFLARSAVIDIAHIEQVLSGKALGMCFYRMLEAPEGYIRFKLFHRDQVLPLTDILPILENMGLSVIEEQSYEIRLSDDDAVVWISDFGMCVSESATRPDAMSDVFQQAFAKVWSGEAENDGFNRLVMKAGIHWRDIMVLRAYAKYLMQIGFRYSQSYMEDTLTENPEIALKLIDLYKIAFHPAMREGVEKKIEILENEIKTLLNKVTNLDKDRILRRFVHLFQATVRTNYFQTDRQGMPKDYLAFKLLPAQVPDMPKPYPAYEIFVYSPRVEGVHLRAAKVARGGLRWSDRREDFRTEVLGLMKAQQVKNAVIVPLGAKGGFVAKKLPMSQDREVMFKEGQACYRIFIQGLLDLTDNRIDNEIQPPADIICFDEPDPYLVVAADKGTATFSDIANDVSAQYKFWLGDAFASGGSNGYDHKKMAITARGAWESVKRNFLSLGHDTQTQDFTVVGIGDMSGDVFGNGMLLSKHIRLVAAFNHLHIFIDPDPDAAISYKERKRLFDLPRSSWADYDIKLLSKGGGIFERSAKQITLSPEIQARFGIASEAVEPNELIQAILSAEVDLLWNGGIGTYVKSGHESHADVGDRSNDAVRIDASHLQCRVVGEGGNLGLTQLARIEFARRGGLIYTDAIDNSAGVDCSDHEVNIKILLNKATQQGDLTEKQRNDLLNKMSNDVATLVLRNNYEQTQVLSRMAMGGVNDLDAYNRLMRELERRGHLERDLEFLPDEKAIKSRHVESQGLATPELAVLMAYTKTVVKRALFDSELPKEPYCQRYLKSVFPDLLCERFEKLMPQHDLADDIIVTQLANVMIQRMGITFVHRMYDETGAVPGMIARAFIIVNELFNMDALWAEIEALDGKVPAYVQMRMMSDVTKVQRRLCRWFLRNRRGGLAINDCLEVYSEGVAEYQKVISDMLSDEDMALRQDRIKQYQKRGVPAELANKVADFLFMFPAMDIVEVALRCQFSVIDICCSYFALNKRLSFSWFREMLHRFKGEGYWETLSTSGMRDDLDKLQRILAVTVLDHDCDASFSIDQRIDHWISSYQFIVDRWYRLVDDLRTSSHKMVRFLVAFRALLDLVQATSHGAESYAHREVHLSL